MDFLSHPYENLLKVNITVGCLSAAFTVGAKGYQANPEFFIFLDKTQKLFHPCILKISTVLEKSSNVKTFAH